MPTISQSFNVRKKVRIHIGSVERAASRPFVVVRKRPLFSKEEDVDFDVVTCQKEGDAAQVSARLGADSELLIGRIFVGLSHSKLTKKPN